MALALQECLKENVTELLLRICKPELRPSGDKSSKKKNKRKQGGDVKRQRLSEAADDAEENTTDGIGRPEDALYKLKQMCKMYPNDAPEVVCHILLKNHLSPTTNSLERERAVRFADEIFQRSSKFRATFCESLRVFLDAVFGDKLPGPNPAKLSETAARVLRGWDRKFGRHYPQLGLALASERISEEATDVASSNASDVMQQNVDTAVADRIKRGFRIHDGAPLSGSGETAAVLISLAVTKLNEVRTCLMLLFPLINDEQDEENTQHQSVIAQPQEHDQQMVADDAIEWEEEEEEPRDFHQAHVATATIDPHNTSDVQISEEPESFSEDEKTFSEDDSPGADGVFVPHDFALQLTMQTGGMSNREDDDESLAAVRQALLDCRLTIERSVIPEIRVWSEAMERVVSRDPIPENVELMVRVKRLLADLQIALARCDRLQIRSRRNVVKVPNAASSALAKAEY